MKRIIALTMASLMVLLTGCNSNGTSISVKSEPIVITIWHYYNGPQKTALEGLITKFNETAGQEKNIAVEAVTHGNVVELSQGILNAAEGKVGADKIPDIFAAYADTAYQIDKLGLVADISKYITAEELAEFIPSYIDEGKLGGGEALKIFPTAKSTEVMVLNKTDWDKFQTATNADIEKLKTMEGMVEISEQYYNYSGGKAFFGRDAMANYMIMGLKQLGVELFEVTDGTVKLNLDEKAMKTLWDNYYIPSIKGYFGAYGKFRSDDVKTGDLIAIVGSTTGVAYFPSEVVTSEKKYNIESMVMMPPRFQDGEFCAVQQGAGMVVTKSDDAHEKAAIEFLKWFVKEENNIHFAIESGYMPVKKSANNIDLINKELENLPPSNKTENLTKSLKVAIDMVSEYPTYTNKAFEHGTEARNILEKSLFNIAKENHAKVQEDIAGGMSREEALAKYISDDNFQAWYQGIYSEFKELGIIA